MAALALRNEERIGLGVAIAAHAALVALVLWRPPSSPVVPPPERMTVTLSDEVGLTSSAPAPTADAAPDVAPELGEPAPPEPPAPVVRPEPLPPQPRVVPAPQPRPAPRAVPSPRLAPKAAPQPRPQPSARPAPRQAQPQPAPSRQPNRTQSGGNRIGNDFLKGAGGTSGQSRTPSAAEAGQLRTSFAQSVMAQVKPKWQGRVPQGLNTDKIQTFLSVELNRDGTLARAPTLIRQLGVDDTNRAQAPRHLEEAVKAVQLSAPFRLPPDMYDLWRRLPPLKFTRG